MSAGGSLPARLAEIVEDFQLCEGPEKLELLLQYAENLPPLPASLVQANVPMEHVPECMTPVSVVAEQEGEGMVFHFKVPEESPTVRGFAAVVADGLRGATPAQVLELPGDFYLRMGLQEVLTIQRMNGMAAMVAHIKRLAVRQFS